MILNVVESADKQPGGFLGKKHEGLPGSSAADWPMVYLWGMNTDTRETLPANGNFYDLVMTLFQQQQKAAILYEDNGVTRAGGLITAVFEKEGKKYLKLDNGLEIALDHLYAVNGTFSSDYSEC